MGNTIEIIFVGLFIVNLILFAITAITIRKICRKKGVEIPFGPYPEYLYIYEYKYLIVIEKDLRTKRRYQTILVLNRLTLIIIIVLATIMVIYHYN